MPFNASGQIGAHDLWSRATINQAPRNVSLDDVIRDHVVAAAGHYLYANGITSEAGVGAGVAIPECEILRVEVRTKSIAA
jgi:hypothetical protein